MNEDRIFVVDAPIWTSAGASAGVDLALAMIEDDLGAELARLVAKKLVLSSARSFEGKQGFRQQASKPAALARHSSRPSKICAEWGEDRDGARVPPRPQHSERLPPIHPWHAQIHHDDVGPPRTRLADGFKQHPQRCTSDVLGNGAHIRVEQLQGPCQVHSMNETGMPLASHSIGVDVRSVPPLTSPGLPSQASAGREATVIPAPFVAKGVVLVRRNRVTTQARSPPTGGVRMRVLLVEDHADTRELFVTYLSSHGFKVDTAVTGLQAIDKASASLPDVIVLDLELPGMDGWAAARHLRNHASTRHVPIVAVSAHAFPEDESLARDMGCDAFLAKPCLPPDLLETIRRFRPRQFA